MKLRTTLLSLAGAVVLGGALLSGCTTETTPGTTVDNRSKQVTGSTDTKATVTGLVENQLYTFSVGSGTFTTKILGVAATDKSSITVVWTRDPLDHGADTIYYEAVSTVSTTANTITWATATKVGPFNIYETSDNTAGHNSGLILADAATKTGSVIADSATVDLVLATDNTQPKIPFLSLVAPTVSSLSGIFKGHDTKIGPSAYLVKGGMANNYFTGDITSLVPTTGTSATNYFDILSSKVVDSSAIILVRTASGNFARVEIVPNSTTGYLWSDTGGASSKRYITVNVVYQPTANWGYVSRPTAPRFGSNQPKGNPVTIVRQ